MLLQPCLRRITRRCSSTDDVPEPGRVVGLDEVGEFVNDGVVDDRHRRFDQLPVDIDIVIQCAGTS